MAINKRRFTILLVCFSSIFLIIIKVGVWDNPGVLCKVAEGFDDPSRPFYFVIERIYKISPAQKFDTKIIGYLKNNENLYLCDVYFRVLGVLGSTQSLYYLRDFYLKHQNEKDYRGTLFYAIRGMGLIGGQEVVPFLKTLHSNYKDSYMKIAESNIVSSLYLITGENKYWFTNSTGEKQKLYLTDELIKARDVIKRSRGRSRTFNEMLILDNIYRPLK